MEFSYELQRADVERLTEPFVARSIDLCRRTLEEKRLAAESIDRVLLVGGTTLVPYVRERLADPREGLGRPLVYDIEETNLRGIDSIAAMVI